MISLFTIPCFFADTSVSGLSSLGYEGISPGWAFLLFLLLAAASIFAYRRFAPDVTRGRRMAMIAFRIAAIAVLAALLTKPVLRLTEDQTVRQPLAILIDGSKSMALADQRESTEDIVRAAIALGLVAPDTDIKNGVSSEVADQVREITRQELLSKIDYNSELNLWPSIAKTSDLLFYQFGASAKLLERETSSEDGDATAVQFPAIKADASATALGDALRQVIEEPRPQPLSGVVIITDGASNQGASPIEAAEIAREANVPLFIYGIGVTSPPDITVRDVKVQSLAFVEERVEVRARIISRNLVEKKSTVILKADGVVVAETELSIGGDTEQDAVFHFIPEKAGEVKLVVSIPLRSEELGRDNNVAATTLRVTDSKFHVLLVEQEPRWDFRYLLDYLQRDPRLEVKCVMIDGEPGLSALPDSPFLPELPKTRKELFGSQVLILGDVTPNDLGVGRMEMIAEWVEAGGGIIFLAGPKFSPSSYANTPLEPLLPIVPDTVRGDLLSDRSPQPFPLELTPAGRRSPYLQMDSDPVVNLEIWKNFPGVRWVAPVARAKPGAEVLLVDPRPITSGRYGLLPVVAMQSYGSGKCVYFGMDETYRWRSKTGEKYYSVLWGQIMQTLALQLLDTASSKTQLRTDRKQYQVGDRVVISGNVYKEDYEPFIEPSLAAELSFEKQGTGQAGGVRSISVDGIGGNAYRVEFIAKEAGRYSFHTVRDPQGVLTFDVVANDLENSETALDDRLLQGMATASGGKFFREEELRHLPEWISATTTRVATYRKIDLYKSIWGLVSLLILLFAEWLLRRMSRLK